MDHYAAPSAKQKSMKRVLFRSRDLEGVRLPPGSEITIKDGPMRNSVAGRVIGLVILLLLSTRAEGRWRVDVEGGASVPTTDIEIAGEKFTPNAGASYAIGGGYAPTEYFELTAQFQNSVALDLFDEESLDIYSVTAGPRLYLLHTGRVHPWLVGQIGWYRASGSVSDCFLFCDGADQHQHREDDTFGLNAGGGVDFVVTDLLSLGVDVRYHDAFSALGGLQFVTTMLNVGFHFGGHD